MISPTKRAMALALFVLAIAACSETPTEPRTPTDQETAPDLAAAAANRWITLADLPSTERRGVVTAVVTNSAGRSVLYVIGGTSVNTFNAPISKVQAYNAATNTWGYKASLPVQLYATNGTGLINGKVYISGGISSYKNYRRELYVYDPATNSWTRKHDMPNTSYDGVTGVLNNRLYVLTGCDQEDCDFYEQQAFSRYDPGTDQWTSLPLPPIYLRTGVGGTIGGKFYVTTGGNQVAVYDPSTNAWTVRTTATQVPSLAVGVTVSAKLYALQLVRTNPDGTLATAFWIYNPSTNAWTSNAAGNVKQIDALSRVLVNGQPRIEMVGGRRPGNNLQYIP
jgi:N-acetylneuraminic acid mutarotase